MPHRHGESPLPPSDLKWHFGCGRRRFPGWHHTDLEVNLTQRLPFPNAAFTVALGQHVIEHLTLTQGLALCAEIHRCLAPDGICYLSTPDLAKVCLAYLEHRLDDFLADRRSRFPGFRIEQGAPVVHFVNHLFHQGGEHQLLYDFVLLEWTLLRAGFREVQRINETTLLTEQPDIPARHDDLMSLYIRARK